MPTGSLPSSGKKLWEKVYNDAKAKGDSEETAAQKAWGAVKQAGWKKDKDGKWSKKAEVAEFSLAICKASFDKSTNEMRWEAVASDTDEDLYGDNMTLELFSDFLDRISRSEAAPEDFRSQFWVGGMPYLSVSHYPDLEGSAVPGVIQSVYVDGNRLKSRGTFSDTPLGRAAFKAVNADLYGENKDNPNKVRISIAFIDWKHQHKDSNIIFERKSLDDMCPECLKNMVEGVLGGEGLSPMLQGPKKYLRGQLIHEAMTRVPVNERTLMEVERSMTTRKEDAASIVGDELAEEIEKQAALVGKSEALVIKMDERDCAEGENPEDCRKRLESAEVTEAEPGMELVPQKADTKKVEDDEPDDDEDVEKCNTKKKVAKSEVDLTPVLSELAQLRAMVTPQPHPLDAAFTALRSRYDTLLSEGADENAFLTAIQEPYSALGEAIKGAVKPKEPAKAVESDPLSEKVTQLSQTVNLILTKLDGLQAPAKVVEVPQRRSIDPRLIKDQKAEVKSTTPTLRAIIERTTL